MKKKLVVMSAILLALLAAGYVALVRHDTPKYTFRFDKVSSGDMSVYVTATGTISAVISVDVGTQVSGIVTKLYADFNSVVKAGQVIARIDTTFLYQSLKDAEASLERAQAQLNDSRRTLVREKALMDRGLDAQATYDAALTAFETNEAAGKSAQAALDRAKINLAYATIYAPINGVVVNRAVNVGQTVAASFSSPTLFTIANDLRRMQVLTTVDESDVGRVSVGQQATFTVDAYPDDKFSGTVSQIRLAPQSVQNVVNYIVVIDVNNDQLKLMPGMTANVNILVANASGVMRVSNMALRFQPPAELVDTSGSGSRRGKHVGTDGVTTDFAVARPDSAIGTGVDAATVDPQTIHRDGMTDSARSVKRGWRGNANGRLGTAYAEATLQNRNNPGMIDPGRGMTKDAQKFGIVSSFPEYQKSAYVPSHESGRGRVWILKPNGRLEQVFVRTGLNDGRNTEIESFQLKPGDQVVLGASTDVASAQTAQNPFAGSTQGRPMGGGFR